MIAYLYGIIECNQGDALGIAGMDGISPVSVVAHDGLGCVVSDYRGEDLFSLPKDKLVRSLLAHQLVVECAMGHHPVLPVKFGTTLDSVNDVRDLLSQGHGEFLSTFATIRDKTEVAVAATWDTKQVLQGLAEEEEIIRARDAISLKGQPTLEEQVKLGQLVQKCLGMRRESYRERMVNLLKPVVVDMASNALLSDEMVMNMAFMVERVRQGEFDSVIQRLDEFFQKEITFRVIGPLPPYSFCTIDITKVTPEQLESARQVLHLGQVSSETEVRRAYRRLAAQAHGYPSLKDGMVSAQVAGLKQASDLLLRCCQAERVVLRGDGTHLMSFPETGSLFLIDIRGSGRDEVDPGRFGGSTRI